MKAITPYYPRGIAIALAALCILAAPAAAEQSGLFTYSVNQDGETVTITDYPEDAIGEIVIPSEIDGKVVTIIGNDAFNNCSGLTEVTIPSTVTGILWFRYRPFHGCSALAAILVEQGNEHFSSDDGVLYDATRSKIILCPEGKVGAYTILESAVSVSRFNPFSRCSKLTSILVEPGNARFASVDGVLCDATKTVLIRCPEGRVEDYTMPETITSIGERAFKGCSKLTSATVPSRLTSIGADAFAECTGLTNVTLEEGLTVLGFRMFGGCIGLRSITIPSSVTSTGESAFGNCSGLTSVTLVEGLTTIGRSMFHGCSGLTSLTFPSSIQFIYGAICEDFVECYSSAFAECSSLNSAVFLGDSPDLLGEVFDTAAPDFTIYYLSRSSGFTFPTWNGYLAVEIDELAHPAAPWLVAHGLPYDTDLNQDLNRDGVSLLMAYALELDPRLNLSSRLPVPIIDSETLTMSFHAASPGITYRVQTSTDLRTWQTGGIILSGLDAENKRTATVPRDSPQRFLRLVVE